MSKLINDTIILESVSGNGTETKVSGIFSQCDVRNKNGRIYTRSLWEKILNSSSVKGQLTNRQMVGELGHPEDPERIETLPERISHVITDLKIMPDGKVFGEAEILDTPMGTILKTLYESGIKIGISSRGYTESECSSDIVPEDYQLVTFDFVLDPSSQDAYPVKESLRSAYKKALLESKPKLDSKLYNLLEDFVKDPEVEPEIVVPEVVIPQEISAEVEPELPKEEVKHSYASISFKSGDIEKIFGQLGLKFGEYFNFDVLASNVILATLKCNEDVSSVEFLNLNNFLKTDSAIEVDEFIINYCGGKITVVEKKKPVIQEKTAQTSKISKVPVAKLQAAVQLAEGLAEYGRTAEEVISGLREHISYLEGKVSTAETECASSVLVIEQLREELGNKDCDSKIKKELEAKTLENVELAKQLTLACEATEAVRGLYNGSKQTNIKLVADLTKVTEQVKKLEANKKDQKRVVESSRKMSEYPTTSLPTPKFAPKKFEEQTDEKLVTVVERMFIGR